MINQLKKVMTPPFTWVKAGTKHQPTTSRPPTEHQQTTNSYININNNKRDIKEIYNNTSIPTSKPTGFSNFTPSASSSVDPEWEKENLKKQLSKFKYN